jgi:hypothetical protein
MRRLIIVLALGLVAMLGGGVVSPAAQELTQTDRQGPVLVTVTLLAVPTPGRPLEVKVALNTHSVALDAIAFERAVVLRRPDGTEAAPTAVEGKGAGHHREAILTFAPVSQAGSIQIVVRHIDGVAERTFTWELR